MLYGWQILFTRPANSGTQIDGVTHKQLVSDDTGLLSCKLLVRKGDLLACFDNFIQTIQYLVPDLVSNLISRSFSRCPYPPYPRPCHYKLPTRGASTFCFMLLDDTDELWRQSNAKPPFHWHQRRVTMVSTNDLKADSLFNVKGYVAVITGGGTGIGLMWAIISWKYVEIEC